MANRFANGRKAFSFCDVCGFRFDLKKLKNLVVKTKQTQIKACPQCWVPDQPQLQLGMYPIADPQAIRDPRPDTNTWYQSGTNGLQLDNTSGTGPNQDGFPGEGMLVTQWGWNPIGGARDFTDPLTPNALVGVGQVGQVTTAASVPPGGIYVNYLATSTGILQAANGVDPGNTLFRLTLIGSRPLADITNDGSVFLADFLAYLRYYTTTSVNPPAFNSYVQSVLNPYMIANPTTYAAYLIFT